MESLNVFRVIVPPCSAHVAWIDVVGHHVAVIGELSITECAFAVLGNNVPVEELPHLSVGSEFPVSPGGDADLQCAERPSGAGAFLLGFALFRSRSGNGESGRVDSGGVSWCSPDWLRCNGSIGVV